MDAKTCDVLSEVDNFFTNGTVNVVRFNKFTQCHSYCPHQNNSKENKCTTNNDRVNALGSYLFNKIMEINKDFKWPDGDKRHIEVFMIWLGDKLFKIDNDYKLTLEESYKNNLEKSMGNLDYWKAIDSKKLYKGATIKKMNEFYRLLNYICKLITEYNKNEKKPNRRVLINHYTQCDNNYKAIHNSINECKPYLQLLDSLKMIYENFRMYNMGIYSKLKDKDKNLLLNHVKFLTTFKGVNQYFVTVTANISFDDKECLEVKSQDEKIGEKISQDPVKSKTPVRRTQTRGPANAQRGNTGSPKLPAKPAPPHPRTPAQPPNLKPPSGKLKLPPPSPGKPVAVKPAPPPQSLPSTPSQTDNKLKTPQAGKPHQNGPGSTVNGGGSVQGNQGSKSGASGDGSRGSSNIQAGSAKGTGKLGGEPGDAAGGKGGSNSNLGVKNSGSGVSGGGTSSGQDGGKVGSNGIAGGTVDGKRSTPGGTGGGKGDAGRGVNGGGSVQGDQGKSSGGTGSGPGGHADKGSQGGSGNQTKPSENSAPVSSGAGTPVPSTPQDPATLPQAPPPPQPSQPPQPQPDQKPDQKPQVQQQDSSPQQTQQAQQPTSPVPAPPLQNDPPLQTPQTGDPNGGNGNPGGGSIDSASNTSGGSFDLGSSIFEFILKGKEYYNKASEFIEKNRQTFEDAAEKISNIYNDAKDNLKSAYNASSDYFNSVINNITSHFNQVDSPPKPGDNQPGSGSPLSGGNSSNQPPSAPPINPPPQNPTLNLPSPTPTLNHSPLAPTVNHPPTTPQQPQQSSSQSQHITQNSPQISPPNLQKIVQLVKSLSSNPNLKKTWNIFPTTWNGSGDCKPEIKFMNTTLICCTSEQCSLTGIPVILVLIPIILLIAYKYLSFGSSKKSEKKNMKRVINFHDGNRKTKIIISSNNRSKHLKPVINLVGGKKNHY
ncbi:PIR protein CIR protein [Plasmodium vinckei petteri]|uniref:PIR protein CIR protein n=1 Tax=Plasmodium vinckei petteri TaxID=138298 RepID=A0A6V7TH03_PLAVN|nr:PIR protein CIR protein [Plasmodium vinckei petteri]